jgi:hypothetical protein
MDSELVARISASHERRLAWFEGHQGEMSWFPGPLADGSLLAAKAKGIFKPADLPYALSIRINLGSTYADGGHGPSRLANPAEAWQRPSQETVDITWQHFREAEDDR